MSKNQRFALLGIAAAIAVIAVIVAIASGGGDDDKGGTTAADTGATTQSNPDTSTTQPPSATPVNPPQPPDQPDRSNVKSIVVEGGEPEGGVQKLKFKKGDKVEIDVVSDQADEAHLHGYDIEKELKPGETAQFRFTADKEGVFELELHESEAQLAKITVEP
jgi:nitrous oxide reductase